MNTGSLYIVATPIGNLDDITFRAVKTLQGVDLIAAEDTRVAQRLLSRYQITTPLISCHEHNEQSRSNLFIKKIQGGQSIALISDAGTPLINDPGYRLVSDLRAHQITIIPIPGPCAAIAALTISGLPTSRFCYEGFLPKRSSERKKTLSKLFEEPRTLIFYESPHRLLNTLQDMQTIFGSERQATFAKELTKVHEHVQTDSLSNLTDWIMNNPDRCRGEFILVVQGNSDKLPAQGMQDPKKLMELLIAHLPTKSATSVAAKITGMNKNELYQIAIGKHKQIP